MDLDPTLSDELQELSLERSITSFKSAEEIERLTVDEHLSDIERAVYLLSSGLEVQRISVIDNLPDLLENHNEECMRRVVPKVREVLHVAQADMQRAACKAFLHILRGELVPLNQYTQTFLQTILMAIDSKDPDIATAWLDTLLDVIDLLPKDIIKKDILGIALAKGQLSQSVQARLSCCRILGKIATKFEPFVIKKDILPVVQSLCQDVDYEVRGCMCRQLDPVARGLGLEATKSAILPELVELTNDEESYVRLAGLETVVHIVSLLDTETCVHTIIPLVCKFCQQAISSDDSTLPTVGKQIGKLCHGLSANLNEEQRHWFLDFYRKLCRVGSLKTARTQDVENTQQKFFSVFSSEMGEEEDEDVECRRHAAFNFPSMVLFAGVRNFKSELASAFSALCVDPSASVRKSIAAGFHEVARLLGNNAYTIQGDFIHLLKDDQIEVLKGLIAHLPETLESLARGGGATIISDHKNHRCPQAKSKNTSLGEVIPALVACDVVISTSHDWRLQEDFIRKLECVPSCFLSDQIYIKFVPVLFRKLHTSRALPVRHAVVHTLLVLLRKTRKLEQRNDMCHRLVHDLCYGYSCHQRSLFVDVCLAAMELFSRTFFKEHLFEALLELALDPIPNVRLRVCPLLPKLKSNIKLPSDRQLLQMLEQVVRRLLHSENDRDVSNIIRKTVEELDRTQVQMESLTKRAFLEDDIADQKKEEEEKRLIEQEERDKALEESKSAKGERKIEKSKKESTPQTPKGSTTSIKKGSKIPTATSTTPTKDREKEKSGIGTKVSEKNKTEKPTALPTSSKSGTKSNLSKREVTGSPHLGIRISQSSASSRDRKGSASSVSSVSSGSGSSTASLSSSPSRRGSTGSQGRPSKLDVLY